MSQTQRENAKLLPQKKSKKITRKSKKITRKSKNFHREIQNKVFSVSQETQRENTTALKYIQSKKMCQNILQNIYLNRLTKVNAILLNHIYHIKPFTLLSLPVISVRGEEVL